MIKGKGGHQSEHSSAEERRMYVAESLTGFSKHLMLLLAAVIAFAATPVLNGSSQYLQVSFALGVIIGIASFIAGHEGITVILNAYIQKDGQDDFIPLEDSLNKGALQKCKRRVEIQYWLMLMSLLIIAGCIIVSAFSVKNTPVNCAVTNTNATENLMNTQAAPNNRDANSDSPSGRPNPNPDTGQPKVSQSKK